jgi:hypothetical protein
MRVAPRTLWGFVPQPGESEFDTEQVDWLLASTQLDAEYGEYGELLSEAMNDDADPAVLTSGYQYVPVGPKTNWAVKAVQDAQDAFYKDSDVSRNGHVWSAKLIRFDPSFKPE